MYNWRLLIFAFFAVIQPIASFDERNLVDGRQQCCDHRFSRDTRNLNGNNPLLTKDRHLTYSRNLREILRQDLRNVQTPLIHSSKNEYRNAQVRLLIRGEPNIRIHSKRATFQPEIGANHIRDTKSDSKRSFSRQNLFRSARVRNIDDRDIRISENLLKHRERENNQRSADRRALNYVSESRRVFAEVQIKGSAKDRSIQRSSSYQNIRRNIERASERNPIRGVLAARDNSNTRHLIEQRSAHSLDRITRNIQGHKRILSESETADDKRQIPSRYRDFRNARERIEVRSRERIDLDRTSISQFNGRESLYRKTTERREIRINNEIRNNKRAQRSTVELRQFEQNVERDTEQPLAARNRSPFRNSRGRFEIRESRRTVDEDRREKVDNAERMLTMQRKNRLNEINTQRIVPDIRGTQLKDNRRESRNERTLGALRVAHQRVFEAGRQQYERKVMNEGVRSFERERMSRTTQNRIMTMRFNRYQEVKNERGGSRSNMLSSRQIDERKNSQQSRDDYRVIGSRHLVDNRLKPTTERTNQNQMDKGTVTVVGTNWQYLMYTVQAIYICTILLPLLMEKAEAKKKMMSLSWGTSMQKLIKVD